MARNKVQFQKGMSFVEFLATVTPTELDETHPLLELHLVARHALVLSLLPTLSYPAPVAAWRR